MTCIDSNILIVVMTIVINSEVFKDIIIYKVMLFVAWLTSFVFSKNEWLHPLKNFLMLKVCSIKGRPLFGILVFGTFIMIFYIKYFGSKW
jgi:hypothetical protein